MSERLNKVLAQHGVGSRREVERWIIEGRLQLNGVNAQIGDRYSEGDRVLLDGRDVSKRLDRHAITQVLAYHKPQGQVIEHDALGNSEQPSAAKLATDDDSGETVMQRLPQQRGVRWVPINPMHAGDSGLLLLTNDGALSYALTRHKKKIPTVYMVRVYVRGGIAAAPKMPLSLRLDNQAVEFTEVEPSGSESDNVWYKVTMARADKRAAVRALFVSNNLIVSRMMQVAFAGIELTKELPRSRHQLLNPSQVELLYQAAELKVPAKPSAAMQVSTETEFKPRPGKRARMKQALYVRDQARRPAAKTTASHSSPAARITKPSLPSARAPRRGGGSNRPSRPTQSRK